MLKNAHTETHFLPLLFPVSKETYRALTKGVQIRVMVICNDRPLATLPVLPSLTTEVECESFKRKKEIEELKKRAEWNTLREKDSEAIER